MRTRSARAWHAVTAAVALTALVLQLVLVVDGAAVLAETDPPSLGLRLARFVAYFTVQSNLLVLVTTTQLAARPDRDGEGWRVVRAAAVAGITITGVVHFVLLRPLLDLDGWSWVADKLLHLAVPALGVLGWLLFGPRPRLDLRVVLTALAWPVAWLTVTLTVGGLSGWFPYPFLDYDDKGWGAVLVASVGITALFVALFAAMRSYDRRSPSLPSGDSVGP